MNFLADPPSSSADNQASSPDTLSQPQSSNKVGTGLQFFPNPILPVVFWLPCLKLVLRQLAP